MASQPTQKEEKVGQTSSTLNQEGRLLDVFGIIFQRGFKWDDALVNINGRLWLWTVNQVT